MPNLLSGLQHVYDCSEEAEGNGAIPIIMAEKFDEYDLSWPTDVLFMLDTPQLVPVNPQECYLKGWFVPPRSVQAAELAVLVGETENRVYTGFPRPDVERHLQSPAGKKSGFLSILPIPSPEQTVSVIARLDGTIRVLATNIRVELRRTLPESSFSKDFCYQNWIFESETLFAADGQNDFPPAQSSCRPKFSLLAEFHECHFYLLDRFLRSLSLQLYPHWQICIAGDFEADAETYHHLQSFAAADSRLILVSCPSASDSCNVWNAALGAADGEFITQVHLWDELHPSTLLEVAASVCSREADVVYFDEDEIDLFGRRCRPQFKAPFDVERLLATNYIGRFATIRRNVVIECGGLASLPAGAREWDLLLRCVEVAGADRVNSITKPLYHARTPEALGEAGLHIPFAQLTDLCQVVRSHIIRTGKQAKPQPDFPTGTIRLQYQIRNDVSASIFLRDEDGIFQMAALAGLADRYRLEFYGIFNRFVHRLPDPLKDNFDICSYQQGTVSRIRFPVVDFGEIAGDVLIFINRPIDRLSHFFLQELMAQALRPDCGLASGLSVDLSGRFLHTGFVGKEGDLYIDPFADADSHNKALGKHVRVVRSVMAVSDDFFAVRREHVEALGGFSELSSSAMQAFVRTLAEHARQRQLQILITPYAIAAFDCLDLQRTRSESRRVSRHAVACLNPNLTAFADPYVML